MTDFCGAAKRNRRAKLRLSDGDAWLCVRLANGGQRVRDAIEVGAADGQSLGEAARSTQTATTL